MRSKLSFASKRDRHRRRPLRFESLEDRQLLAADALTATVGSLTLQSDPVNPVAGYVDVSFMVPAGLTPRMSGYNAELHSAPSAAGLTFTGVDTAANPVFPGQRPQIFQQGTILRVADYLPGMGQSRQIVDGSGLLRANFSVAAGTTGIYELSLALLLLADENGDFIPNVQLQSGTITVLPTPTVSIQDRAVVEGTGGTAEAVFTVQLSSATNQSVKVDYATSDGTALAVSDYTTTAGTLTFAPYQTSQEIHVPIATDALDEPSESFVVNLSNPVFALLGDSQAEATIDDDDPPPALSVGDVQVTEGDAGTAVASLTVSLSAASGKTIQVDYATADGTAIADDDYTGKSGTLIFTPGETSKAIDVPVRGETDIESDETFYLDLSGPLNASIADSHAEVTILNDDFPIVFGPMADVDLATGSVREPLFAGTTLPIALVAHDRHGYPLTYTVTSSDPAALEPQLTAADDRSLRIDVQNFGVMDFQLYDDLVPDTVGRIAQLAAEGFYDSTTFHRIVRDYVAQGGSPSADGHGGSGFMFDDQFNPLLWFTSPRVLALANSGPDTNDSQFFITATSARQLDFQQSIVGFLTAGDEVRDAINNVPTDASNRPATPVVVQSISVFDDPERQVLLLSAPRGAAGTFSFTVTADNGHGDTVTRTFQVTIQPDDGDNTPDPYLLDTAPLAIPGPLPVGSVQLVAADPAGAGVFYDASLEPGPAGTHLSVDHATGLVTVTADPGVAGVAVIQASVRSLSGTHWDTEHIPVFVSPAAPDDLTLVNHSNSDPWTSNRDNSAPGEILHFRVQNVAAGAEVTLLADGHPIGHATSTVAGSLDIYTDGASPLAIGDHSITVVQTLVNQNVPIETWHAGSVNLASLPSPAWNLRVAAQQVLFTTTPPLVVAVGQAYVYRPATNVPADIVLVSGPAGMTWDAAAGSLDWLPTAAEQAAVVLRATSHGALATSIQQEFVVQSAFAPVVTPLPRLYVAQGSFLASRVEAHGQSPLTYSLQSAPAGAWLDPDTGRFSWTPSVLLPPGIQTVGVKITDTLGLATSGSFEIEVTLLDDEGSRTALYDPDTSIFHFRGRNATGYFESDVLYGSAGWGWLPLLGDWDGDGVDTVGLYDPSLAIAYLRNSNTGGPADVTGTIAGVAAGLVPLAGDWDGDGRDFLGLYDPRTRVFQWLDSSQPTGTLRSVAFPSAGADWTPVAGDWDGDGRDTLALYDPATSVFHLFNSLAAGAPETTFVYGVPGLGQAVAGDWSDAGADAPGIYTASVGMFYLRNTATPGPADETFVVLPSQSTWIPLSGDWDIADRLPPKTDMPGLFVPDSGQLYLKNSQGAGPADLAYRFLYSTPGMIPLSGDWNGNGVDTPAFYDPASSTFYLLNGHVDDPAPFVFRYGVGGQGWLPISGDWDGDGQDTVGLYDPAVSRFYLKNSHTGGPSDTMFYFGVSGLGWLPIAGNWDGRCGDTVGLYDPASSTFFLKNDHYGEVADASFVFGVGGLGWQPLVGNWDGIAGDCVGLYAPDSSTFFLKNARTCGDADAAFVYGVGGLGLRPLAGDWDGRPVLGAAPAAAPPALAVDRIDLAAVAAAQLRPVGQDGFDLLFGVDDPRRKK